MAANDFILAFVDDVVEEARIAAEYPRRRQPVFRHDPFELSEQRYKKLFRLDKELIQNLMGMIEPIIIRKTQFDLKTKVLCALHFFGHGSYQSPVGENIILNMSQSSVSRCIAEVVEALNHSTVFGRWVHFPESFQQLNQLVGDFYNKHGFPGVIGCIDCTHCAIVPPAATMFDERSYVNRKNYHSINTQLICDTNLKIINVNALFPGGSHDCHIWNNYNVLTLFEQLHNNGYSNYHVIGDSGYALRPWCLTPIQGAEKGTQESLYNDVFKKTRCTIERCNGVLKARFRCLLKDRVLHYSPNKATKIINACTVLHNMCVEKNLEEPVLDNLTDEQLGIINLPPFDVPEEVQGNRVNPQLALGRIKRRRIVQSYFS